MDAIFGNLEEFSSEVIYPYRWWFAAATLVTLAVGAYIAYRRRWDRVVLAHKVLAAAVIVPALLVGLPGGYYVLSPLWDRTTLVEAAPDFDRGTLADAGIASPTPTPTASPADPGTVVTSQPSEPAATPVPDAATEEPEAELVAFGTWSGADDFHFANGEALIIETSPGQFILRVENFSVRNGPDLFVYLSPDADGYADSAINLGELKATDGAFNYEIPAGVDVTEFRSAVIWCKQFSVEFGSAPLTVVSN